MCNVTKILNQKPKTSRPCEMLTLHPGECMKVGKGKILKLNTALDTKTNERVSLFIVSKGISVSEAFTINKVMHFKSSGLKITPISIITHGKNKGSVHLFIELMHSLQTQLNPAS